MFRRVLSEPLHAFAQITYGFVNDLFTCRFGVSATVWVVQHHCADQSVDGLPSVFADAVQVPFAYCADYLCSASFDGFDQVVIPVRQQVLLRGYFFDVADCDNLGLFVQFVDSGGLASDSKPFQQELRYPVLIRVVPGTGLRGGLLFTLRIYH